MLLEGVAEKSFAGLYFSIDKPPLSEINPTTWTELRDKGYVAPLFSTTSRSYGLTGRGYLKALRVAGITERGDFKSQLGVLAATLKKYVKGRQQAAFVNIDSVQQESGLSSGFIFNCIDSNLLEVCFNKKGAQWANGFRGTVIVVQPTFGQEPVDF